MDVDVQMKKRGAGRPCLTLPSPVHILQAPWPPGMSQSWAGDKRSPISRVMTEESFLAWPLSTPRHLLAQEIAMPSCVKQGSLHIAPLKPHIQQGHTQDYLT